MIHSNNLQIQLIVPTILKVAPSLKFVSVTFSESKCELLEYFQ